MTVILGGDAAALNLFSALADQGHAATLVLCEEPVREAPSPTVDGAAVVHAKALKTVMAEHRVAGLITHADGAEPVTRPGPVVLAGRRPTRLWTGDGGWGHGLALGLLAGAQSRGLGELDGEGPRGGVAVEADGRTSLSGLYAVGGAVAREGADARPDLGMVAEAVVEDRVPDRVPDERPPQVDRPMPEGFAGPKVERLRKVVRGLSGGDDAGGDDEALAAAEREVRGLFGEMRSYLQARRSEELLDLRDAVVVAMAVIQALAAKR